MKVVQINSFGNLSTGSVMRELDEEYRFQGNETWMFWGRGRPTEGKRAQNFNTRANCFVDALLTRLDGRAGFHSTGVTRQLLRRLDEIDPDVVHLHNLHGYFVNIGMLFAWLVNHRCQVRWTLHDCWAFTGHCAYFTYVGCEQWKTHCALSKSCPQLGAYPKTLLMGNCARNFEDKRRIFTSVPPERMTLITPSHWLEGLVRQSFLKEYPVQVRHNSVDTDVFKPTSSDFRERYGINDRFMILGVASTWDNRKGLDDFTRLSEHLNQQAFAVVLIGLTSQQINKLPAGLVGVSRTNSREELAGIYSTADVFFNPTREDNYPTVNLEAEACGLPVVTYDTGGCRETIHDERSVVVPGLQEALGAIEALRFGRLP